MIIDYDKLCAVFAAGREFPVDVGTARLERFEGAGFLVFAEAVSPVRASDADGYEVVVPIGHVQAMRFRTEARR